MNTPSSSQAVAVIRGLVVFDALIFVAAALLHLGGRFSIGPIVLVLGRIIPATVVEGLIGIVFLVTAYALFAHLDWARRVAIGVHVFALAGTLVGLRAVASGSSPYKALNVVYHEVMLAVIVAGLVLLFIPGIRATLQDTGKDSKMKVTRA